VVQSENVRRGAEEGTIIVTERVRKGQYVFPKGRDVKRGEVVLERGRVLRATDQVLLESLHMDRVGVCRKPRVAIIPTGNELSSRIRGTEPGKVVETHGLLLSRLVEGAGGVPNLMPIVRDDLALLVHSMRRALKVADLVLNSAGSSVGEADLTEKVIAQSGKPGMLVHGMKVLQGRVMGFGAVDGKAIVIIPGRIAGAVNAFAVLGYPVIRSFLGRGFEGPPSLPATVGSDWEAESHYSDFLKLVYARLRAEGTDLIAEPSWSTSEKITHFTRNDGYILVPEDKLSLKKGERVLVHVLPGISGYGSWGSL
jgi:molybdenum cofactor synthesis domain-containing protein